MLENTAESAERIDGDERTNPYNNAAILLQIYQPLKLKIKANPIYLQILELHTVDTSLTTPAKLHQD